MTAWLVNASAPLHRSTERLRVSCEAVERNVAVHDNSGVPSVVRPVSYVLRRCVASDSVRSPVTSHLRVVGSIPTRSTT